MLAERNLILSRLHFTGLIPPAQMIKYLQAADAHLYLSAPFILPWSFVDAMACATPIIAARSQPVEEFMPDSHRGLLVDPDDCEEVSGAIAKLVDSPDLARTLGKNAREHIVSTCDAASLVDPGHMRFFKALAGDHAPE